MTPQQRLEDLKERFPWHRQRPGESFFVPTLDPDETMRQGLVIGRAHHGQRAMLRAKFGIVQGTLGVLFTAPR
jgi:hypothetical protein